MGLHLLLPFNPKDDQTVHRDHLILKKRLKVESLEEAKRVLSAEEDFEKVGHALRLLRQGKRVVALTLLRKCFARDDRNAENFLRQKGFRLLRRCLMSSDAEVMHAAAWCAVNLTAGASLKISNMRRFLSTILTHCLNESDPQMQELCAWAIGNLAGDTLELKENVMQQGCIPYLIALVSSSSLTLKARSQSVLFALINLARCKHYDCIRCMQENSIFNRLDMMLRATAATNDLCFEIGWLTYYIYGRRETYLGYRDQYLVILNSVIAKLSQLLTLKDKVQRDKIILPYLLSLGNIIGLNPDLALVASGSLIFLSTLFDSMSSDTGFLKKEGYWILLNFMAEPSCRGLVEFQPRFLQAIFSLCQNDDEETALNGLYLLSVTLKVSSLMSRYLVEHGAEHVIIKLLTSPKSEIQETALKVLMDLDIGTEQGRLALLDADELAFLQTVASGDKSRSVREIRHSRSCIY